MRSFPGGPKPTAILVAALLAVAALLLSPGDALATPPGENGRIAFSADGEIYSLNLDGSDPRLLTADPAPDQHPSWSPDGSAIAFERGADVRVMSAAGTGGRLLVTNARWPAWSPDGSSIAVSRASGAIDLVSPIDGRTLRTVTTDGRAAAWSPDGARLAFFRGSGPGAPGGSIHVADADGSDVRGFESAVVVGVDSRPSWSPDGNRIVFSESRFPSRGGAQRAFLLSVADGAVQPAGDANDVVFSPDGARTARAVEAARSSVAPFGPTVPGLFTTDPTGASAQRLVDFRGVTDGIDWHAVARPGTLTEREPLRLDRRVYRRGDTVTGTVRWVNTGSTPVRIRQGVITIRRPGATNLSGPFDDFSPRLPAQEIAPGAEVSLTASLRLPRGAPRGRWSGFATWQDEAGAWHDGPSVTFRVQARRRPGG